MLKGAEFMHNAQRGRVYAQDPKGQSLYTRPMRSFVCVNLNYTRPNFGEKLKYFNRSKYSRPKGSKYSLLR
jgi:hypothetical protein